MDDKFFNDDIMDDILQNINNDMDSYHIDENGDIKLVE